MSGEKIAVMGLGYVGLATALTLSYLGHEVIGYDPVTSRVQSLSDGQVPIYEDGIKELLNNRLESGKITFSNYPSEAIGGASFSFICVGTPSRSTGEADLSQVRDAAKMIGKYMNRPMVVINKSTVPVGTGDKVEKWVREAQSTFEDINVVSNPEFLQEGQALRDSLNPSRIVLGAESSEVGQQVAKLYEGLGSPILIYDRRTAEMVKYASNAFLATKISFINEIAAICDRVGADVSLVSEGMGYDPRIGPHFLNAGIGYGGSCFPKDTSALIQIAGNVYYDFKLLKAVVDVNIQSRLRVIQILEQSLDGLNNRTIAVLGLSFKPGTDDIRESAALTIIPALIERGARVKATDPVALEKAFEWFASSYRIGQINSVPCDSNSGDALPHELALTSDVLMAVDGADAVLLLTEWAEYVVLDWSTIKFRMKGNLVIDGRNVLLSSDIRECGLDYKCIGRPRQSNVMKLV